MYAKTISGNKLQKRPYPPEIAQELGGGLEARILAARQVSSKSQLDYSLQNLPHFNKLHGLEAFVEGMEQALKEQQKIIIVGDFDCDGATSTSLCLLVLRAMGYKNLEFIVPHRQKDGYGLSVAIVDKVATTEGEIIITVDNGISAVNACQHAIDQGIRVFITDHHLPPPTLPQAQAIINPNSHNCTSGFHNLAGVGVIFYALVALRSHLQSKNYFSPQKPAPNMGSFLDLVAIGTIADVVKLDYQNRLLVQNGLKLIQNKLTRPGVKSLLQSSTQEKITTHHLAFQLAPKINAAGRLDDMRHGIQLLLEENPDKASSQAMKLSSFNKDRQEIQKDILEDLQRDLQASPPQAGIVVFKPHWHEGVIGIVAGKLKESYHKPSLVFCQSEQPGFLKGSGRSIPQFHLKDALGEIALLEPDLFVSFGGHAMAAGMLIREQDFQRLKQAFVDKVQSKLGNEDQAQTIFSDGPLTPQDLSLETYDKILEKHPWGHGFERPIFHNSFQLHSCEQIKTSKHYKAMVSLEQDSNTKLEALIFDKPAIASFLLQSLGKKVTLVYSLRKNSFRNISSINLTILDALSL